MVIMSLTFFSYSAWLQTGCENLFSIMNRFLPAEHYKECRVQMQERWKLWDGYVHAQEMPGVSAAEVQGDGHAGRMWVGETINQYDEETKVLGHCSLSLMATADELCGLTIMSLSGRQRPHFPFWHGPLNAGYQLSPTSDNRAVQPFSSVTKIDTVKLAGGGDDLFSVL